MAWGAIIGLAASAIGSGMQANAQKKAAAELNRGLDVRAKTKELGYSLEDVFGKRLEPPEFGFSEEDIYRITERLAEFNSGRGTDLANQSATKINENTLKDLEAGMARLFGGTGSYERQRDAVNRNAEDFLAGKLSRSTRQALARRVIGGGASALGQGAVDDQYAAYLGLTTEDIVSRGTEIYRSMYQTYRQAFPLVTGANILPYTTLTPEAGVNLAFQTSVAQYEADLNSALAEAAPDPVASGLLQAEMQRAGAVTGANLQARSAAGGAVSSIGQQAGGLVSGGGFSYGNFSGVM